MDEADILVDRRERDDSLAREEQQDGRAELVELQEQLVHKEREGRGRGRHSGGKKKEMTLWLVRSSRTSSRSL